LEWFLRLNPQTKFKRLLMKYYQVPGGYPDFQSVVEVFEKNLPEGFKVIATKEGGKMPTNWLAKNKTNPGRIIGSINIRQNSYNAVEVSLTSVQDTINDTITVVDYVPSWIIRFLRGKVLGYLTNLIFPAIYGTSKKIYAAVDKVLMDNYQLNEMDMSFGNTMKNMFKGQAMTEVKNSSVK
jgi:hypothetical protein